MSQLKISGIDISFPFQPYDSQVGFMDAVITALQSEKNALLESPTGTGKTLSLLCSTLSWLSSAKARMQFQSLIAADPDAVSALGDELLTASGNMQGSMLPPRIIYATRTHSQISQVMGELKRTNYKSVKTAVLGSRDQLCIHPTVSQQKTNAAKQFACRSLTSTRTCMYYNNTERRELPAIVGDQTVLDIEDLLQTGVKQKVCPYYLTRRLAKGEAELIFLPYNYLIDPMIRQRHGLELQGSVVVFDEAHNLPQIAEEAASVEICSSEINLCLSELDRVLDLVLNDVIGSTPFSEPGDNGAEGAPHLELLTAENVAKVKAILLKFETKLSTMLLKKGQFGDESSFSAESDELFRILANCDITPECYTQIYDICDAAASFLANPTQIVAAGQTASVSSQNAAGIAAFNQFLKVVFESESPANKLYSPTKCYKLYVKTSSNKFKGDRVLSYWCFSPHFALRQLKDQGVRSIILSSGTLKPLPSFKIELGLPFDIMYSAPHVIQMDQILVSVARLGIGGKALNSSYKNRENPEYLKSLGISILQIMKLTPGGTLVFFPSYTTLKSAVDYWTTKSTVMNDMQSRKLVCIEPRDKTEFNSAMSDFYNQIDSPDSSGAVFMAVCRGKVSEGLDFKDKYGRSVIITGIPFAPAYDPRVIMKKQYLNTIFQQDKKALSGDAWYHQQASRAVNQAVGRVIRHKHDYGAIYLLDERFSQTRMKNEFPEWLSGKLQVHETFQTILRDGNRFFSNIEPIVTSRHKLDKLTSARSYDTEEKVKPVEFTSWSADEVKQSVEVESKPSASQPARKRIRLTNQKLNLFGNLPVDESSTDSHTSDGSNMTSHGDVAPAVKIHLTDAKKRKVEAVAVYMREVRSAVSPDVFTNFRSLVKGYLSTRNASLIEQCLQILGDLQLETLSLGLKKLIKMPSKSTDQASSESNCVANSDNQQEVILAKPSSEITEKSRNDSKPEINFYSQNKAAGSNTGVSSDQSQPEVSSSQKTSRVNKFSIDNKNYILEAMGQAKGVMPSTEYYSFKKLVKQFLSRRSAEDLSQCIEVLERHKLTDFSQALRGIKVDDQNMEDINKSTSDLQSEPPKAVCPTEGSSIHQPTKLAASDANVKKPNVQMSAVSKFMKSVKNSIPPEEFIDFKRDIKTYLMSDNIEAFVDCVRILDEHDQTNFSQVMRESLLKEKFRPKFEQLYNG